MKRSVMPTKALANPSRMETNLLFQRIDTEDDGACALHSLLGVPNTEKGNKLFRSWKERELLWKWEYVGC